MVPNMAGVFASITASRLSRNEQKRKEREKYERYEREEQFICRKTIPCRWCLEDFEESCPKTKVTK